MKMSAIGLLAGVFVLVAAGAGHAGPNVGGKNFGIQGREMAQAHNQSKEKQYALTGEPKNADTKWERSKPRNPTRRLPASLRRVPVD